MWEPCVVRGAPAVGGASSVWVARSVGITGSMEVTRSVREGRGIKMGEIGTVKTATAMRTPYIVGDARAARRGGSVRIARAVGKPSPVSRASGVRIVRVHENDVYKSFVGMK